MGTATHALRGLFNDIRFGEMLTQKLDDASDGLDAATQLAAMFAGGMPPASVAQQVASAIGSGLAHVLGNRVPQSTQVQLQRALASALAPPGTAPPGQQAQMLLDKVRSVIATVTRATTTDAGQQNRFSGNILDAAKTAKEPPAPLTETETVTQAVVSAALARLTATSTPSATGSSQAVPAAQATTPAPQNASVVHAQTAVAQAAAIAPAPQSIAATSDILTRILARAVNQHQRSLQIVGTRVPSDTSLASTPAASGVASPAAHAPATNPSTVLSAQVLFERLAQQIVAAASNADGNASGQNAKDGGAFGASDAGTPSSNVDFSRIVSSAFASAGVPAASVGGATPALASASTNALDPQAVIDQIVRAMAVRTDGDTTNVRLRLTPEHLGEVAVNISVTGGTIDASIVAANPDVRDLLASHQHQLAHSLSEAGLSLGNFSVDVSGGGNSDGRSTDPQLQQTRRALAPFSLAAAENDEAGMETRFGPAILPRPNDPWLLNYFA